MRVVIVGGGMAGLVLARGLLARGVEPAVLERHGPEVTIPGPIMLPFQAYDALNDVGVLDAIRARGRDIPPYRDGLPVAIGVGRQELIDLLREGVTMSWRHEVRDLVRTGDRVSGLRVATPDGERTIDSDLVVGADGAHSAVRQLAGIAAEVRTCDTASLGFRSTRPLAEPFHLEFLSDGRQIMVMGWSGGTAGSWQIDRMPGGADEARAPGLDAFRSRFAALLPQAADALAELTDVGELSYREATEVQCERWWAPGVTLIGEALHAMNPEAGIGSGLGMGDALALAVAVAAHRDDPDAACADYERWRRPAIAPYLAVGSRGVRVETGRPRRPEEDWPPRD
jgi:2-polyprenyl-6-methoxyphenol hydroxylase-like FAD-dependent oxidoreductase